MLFRSGFFVCAHAVLDFHRSIDGRTGVAIQRAWCTKQSKHPITNGVNHSAFMARDERTDMQNDGIKDVTSLLNIAIIQQGNRPLDIRKKCRDKLVLTGLIETRLLVLLPQEGATTLADDVGRRAGSSASRARGSPQGRAAMETKVVVRRLDRSATGARQRGEGHRIGEPAEIGRAHV